MGRWIYEPDDGFGSVIGIIFVLAIAVAIIYIVFWIGVIVLIGYLIYLIVNYFRNKNQKEKELEEERKRKYVDHLTKNNPQTLLPPLPSDFFVFINNKKYGPYNITELSQMRQRGQFTEDTLVWKEGMEQWTEARSCCELLSVFGIGKTEISFQEWKKQNPGKSLNDFYATKRKN